MNRDICTDALLAGALLRPPWVHQAFRKVNREDFVPDTVWLPAKDPEGNWEFVDRAADAEKWRQAVWNPYQSVVTQLDDGAVPRSGPSAGDFTSSVSALDIVMRKLGHLDLQEGHRVLEIGYASGYHTALLCERVTSSNVTAVEVDESLAAWGESHLKQAGYSPHLICGDGLQGAPSRAPFDRIINTASLRRVPVEWVEQAAPGAVVLTPFGTAYNNTGLLRLAVDSGSVAEGYFVGQASYMWIRGERPAVDLQVPQESTARRSPVAPEAVLEVDDAHAFAIGLQVPDVSYSFRGEGQERRVQFVDEAGTSATIVRYADWWKRDAVRSWGPRDLWAEVTAAYTWYEEQGRPHITRFGVTVDRNGQRVWLDNPGNPVGWSASP
ncbi:methyltransferase domain-containing protein [Streptomyces sp. NPDC002054]|uniref:methyltransferase domain-containing protein n=1 Tax=Streptomyces sp. NPDC002054 TaxID=3154663 RepID=UPI0033262858